MKRFNLDSQIACIVAFTLSLIVYFICTVPYVFNARRNALIDVKNNCTSFETAIIKATNDFNNNKYRIVLTGLLELNDAEEKEMLRMEKEDGIIFLSGGCGCCGDYVAVYQQVMKHLINEKYKKMMFYTSDTYSYYYFKNKKPRPLIY